MGYQRRQQDNSPQSFEVRIILGIISFQNERFNPLWWLKQSRSKEEQVIVSDVYTLSKFIKNDEKNIILSGSWNIYTVSWNSINSVSGGLNWAKTSLSHFPWELEFILCRIVSMLALWLLAKGGRSDVIPISPYPLRGQEMFVSCFFPLRTFSLGILSLETHLLQYEKARPQRLAMCCHNSPTKLLANYTVDS